MSTLSVDLRGRVAVVSGGASGIGLALARALLANGACVVVGCLAPEQNIVVSPEAGWETFCCDVTDRGQIIALADHAEKRFGPVDILVNSAGIVAYSPFVTMASEEWQRIMDVNLNGAFHITQIFAQRMVAGGRGGRIINISSVSARQPARERAHYCAAKAGLSMMTEVAALELAPAGITVNAIGPGTVETPFTQARLADPERREKARAAIPVGRFAAPGDMVGMALLLASDAGAYITGQTLLVDGGLGL
ncbi:3beta-hydroxysteroid dehydrogenase 1 [Hyphomicrobiales bacterium]|nr:3beta-hydroxysteroid dehydrogenase 1 [Hyphomicrobiales bacterium]CAH1691820.1 3beta-hydroxysteroid dehydrogenase 1 [Hyphomicrobiales bacterium]